ncbi:MAG: hypothetical protein IJN92_09435 [Lachnospiraceae bacterium]|nr:hypothetical protein [Lachnospiraceae bacterium]
MNEITYSSYGEFKKELDTELQKTSESFVKIGYLLKVAMDTDILKESEYFNVNDFAKGEYDLDPTQVSRFININNRFAENGNSPFLKEGYRGIGYAKLSLMLQLPDSVNEEITPAFSKSEVQAIKDEVEEEKKTSEIELWLEGTKEGEFDNNLHKVFHQLLHDEYQLYADVYKPATRIITESEADFEKHTKELHEALAPDGEKIYSVRIQGVGRLLLSIKDTAKDITLTNIRTDEKESYSWQQLIDVLKNIIIFAPGAKESWETVYGESFPKEEIAPVQPPKRKDPKVTKAKPEKKKQTAAVQEKTVTETEENVSKQEEIVIKEPESVSEQEETVTKESESVSEENSSKHAEIQNTEQIEGQTNIQDNFPQYMPDETKENDAPEGNSNMAAGYKAGITTAIRRIKEMAEQERWQAVITATEDIKWRAEQLLNLENKEEIIEE